MIKKALATSRTPPKSLITDGLTSYGSAIQETLEKDGRHVKHIASGLADGRNNIIESFHGTLRERSKIMRGLDNQKSAQAYAKGMRLYYNFVRYVANKLQNIGVKNISYEARIPSDGRVDILAFDRKNKIAVECFVQFQPNKIKDKITNINKLVDRLIVCVPEFEARKLEGFKVEVWPYSELRKPCRIVISEDVYERLLEVATHMGIQMDRSRTFDEVIKSLVECWKKGHHQAV